MDHIFRQLLLPADMAQLDCLLRMVDRLLDAVACYVLGCNMTLDSVKEACSTANRET